MNRLGILLITVLLNVAVLVVSLCWLAGQSTTLMGWAAVSREHSVTIGSQGWIWQRTSGSFLAPLHGGRIGIALLPSSLNAPDTDWETVLSDGDLSRPLPGLYRYSSPVSGGVQLIAVRHWLLFLWTVCCWAAWQLTVRRWHKNNHLQSDIPPPAS